MRVTDQEAVRKIIEQYIDKVDLEIHEKIGLVRHPAWRDNEWKSEANLPKEPAALLKTKNNPAELQKLNDTAKGATKENVQKWPLADIFCCLKMPYAFKILKDAKAYISTDEFSQLLRAAWEAVDFEYSGSEDFTRDEILELLESCNIQKFMTSDEWKEFEGASPIVVYRGSSTGDGFIWADTPIGVIRMQEKFGGTGGYDGYKAYIKSEDILAAVIIKDIVEYLGYIVNPDKLYNVMSVSDLRDDCDRDELDEEDWEGYEGGGNDDDDDEDDDCPLFLNTESGPEPTFAMPGLHRYLNLLQIESNCEVSRNRCAGFSRASIFSYRVPVIGTASPPAGNPVSAARTPRSASR